MSCSLAMVNGMMTWLWYVHGARVLSTGGGGGSLNGMMTWLWYVGVYVHVTTVIHGAIKLMWQRFIPAERANQVCLICFLC